MFPELIIRATGVRDAALVGPSAEYVRLRGLAQPAVLVTMVAQAGLLAQQDSLTPALTVALSTVSVVHSRTVGFKGGGHARGRESALGSTVTVAAAAGLASVTCWVRAVARAGVGWAGRSGARAESRGLGDHEDAAKLAALAFRV